MKQWKRLAALSSAIVMAAATLTYFPNDTLQNIRLEISASAETTTEPQVWIEDNLIWTLTADGTLTISGTGKMKNYNDTDKLSPVYNNSNVKKVVIEDGVTSIGNSVFDSCSNLASITIPSSVTSIGNSAFYKCTGLTSITIPDGVTSIGTFAFSGCSSLPSITIPDSVTSIEFAAFNNCSSLTSITIPDSVTSIGQSAFEWCSSLSNITLPNNITNIEYCVFHGCSSLTSITIPDGVTSIGANAFERCSSLTSITIPDSVTSIGNYAFYDCKSLTNITIPDSVTRIGSRAFSYCTSLKTISLSCKSSLKKSDFRDQADLVSYTSHTLKKTEAKAATCTEDGNKEYWTCEHCKKYFLSDDTNPETAKAVEQSETIIPASHKLTKVKEEKAPTCTESGNKEYWTCKHCEKYFLSDDTNPATATAVELSETVIPALKHKNATTRGAVKPTETEPGYSGDRYCPDCDTVFEKGYTYWNEDNLTWTLDADGTLTISGTGAMKDYSSSEGNRSPVCKNSNVKKVVIEDGVTSIGDHAFRSCNNLTSITIPDSVTSIGDSVFSFCGHLTSITIPDSVTSIGNRAFVSCTSLTSITIPDSVTSIGNLAFSSCWHLTSITIPDSVISIGNRALSNCSSLTSITIPDSVTSIGTEVFQKCTSLQTISLSCGSALKKSDFGKQADLVSYTNQHALIKTAAKAATCTEDGNKEYWTCEHCKKYFLSNDTNPETAKAVEQAEFIIPASHKLTKVEAKALTCTEDGNKEYWTCEHCGKYFLSDDTNPKTAKAVEQAETVIPALKHKNATTRGAVEPNGTKPGYSGDRYCPDCDTVFEKGYTYWNEGNLTWKLDADGTLTISGTGTMKDYDYNNNPSPANQKKGSVKKVVIKDGVTSIGNFAFYNCKSLTSITIPDSVTSIELAAFNNCNNLTSITIPDSVTSIGDSAFELCNKLSSITLSNNITSIGNWAFHGCPLTSITIPDSVTSIGAMAFYSCSSLKTISLSCGSALKKSDFGGQANLVSYTNQHLLTKTAAKDATCTEDGNIEHWTCEHCGKYFLSDDTNPETAKAVEQSETIIPVSHKLTKVKEEKAPTCTEDGNKEYWTCEHCGKYFLSDDTNPETAKAVEQSETVISASHKLTKVEAKAATCTENGNKEYWTCEHCGKYFLSDDTNPETAKAVELSETVISASHKLTKVEAKAATCSESGNKEYWTCEHCGKYFLSDDTNPETAKAVELSETITPALKHKNATTRGVAEPTETAPGYSGDLYCPDCDTVLEKGYTYWNEGNLTWKLDADGTLTISGTGAMKNYNSDDNRSPVFKNLNVKKIVIEDGVTSIGEKAFSACKSLTSITIPDSVTSIGKGAFSYTGLKSITIPDSVTSIGNSTFFNCKSLTSITIPDGVTSIGYEAFSYTGLKSITIPDSVTSIGESAFSGCWDLTSITIPDSVTSIRNYAFNNCKNLTSITIPDSVTSIGNSAFRYCSSLTSITIPDSVTSIGASAFGYCSDLISITIPDSVTSIRDSAFNNCTRLQTISLSCKSTLKKSDFGEQADLVSYTNQHFLTKTAAKDATCSEDGNKEYWTCEHCGKYFLSDDTNPETAKAVEQSETIIPASHKLTKVEAKAATCAENGNKAYWTCEHCGKYFLSDDANPETAKAVELSETILPAIQHKNAELRNASEPTETSPGYSGDLYCPDCDKVVEKGYTYWNEGNLTWKLYEDGTLNISGTGAMKDYNSDDNPSPASQKKDSVKKIVIEDGVTSIGDSAFSYCSSLTNITIPDSVTSIGDSAFSGCWDLTSITIPDSITTIGESAFSGCSGLTSITIPNSVTSIGAYAFSGCRSLTSITIPDSVTSIGNSSFSNCWYLTSITIPNSVTSIGTYAFSNCWYLTSITIPDSVTSIGKSAFYKCSSLTTISLSCKSTLKKSNFGEQADLVSYTNEHTLTKTAAKDATCAEDGNKEYWTCEHCGKYFLSDDTNPETATAVELSETVIPASHKLTKVEAKAATCTENGNKEYWTCEHCGKYFLSDDTNPETAKAVELSETVISASHKLTKVEAKDATCAEDGNKAYWTCEHCKKYFLSDDSNSETAKAVELSETVIPASHKLTKVEAKAATCSESGNKEYWTCEHCKKYFLSDDTNPKTAKAVEFSETVIPASHKLTKVEAKAATCSESGNKEYWTCEHCKKYFLSDDTNPKTAKAVEFSETVIPASHKLTKVEAKAATCTEDGNKEYWTCEHCGKYFLSDDSNPETAKAVELSETVIPALVQVATTTTPIKCVYGQDMSKIDLRDYVKNTDVVGEVTVKVATGSALPDGMKLDNGKISGKPAKAYEDGKEVIFTFTAENGSTANLTLLFLVAKADPTVEVSVSGDSHTEGDLVSELKLILSENSTKGVVKLVSEIKALVAGKNTFTWKFIPEDENNYHTVTGTVVVNAQTTTTTTTKATTTTTKATTTTKPSKTTTTKVTTTTKPSKTTTTKVTTTTKPSKTTTTNATTTTKPSKMTTTKVTTTTKPSKTTTTKVTTTTITTTTNTAIPSYGDVNLDGKVDIVDAIFLNKYLATLIQFSDAQMANADCCQDGVLNDQDTTALMQFIILLIDDLPVQPTEK